MKKIEPTPFATQIVQRVGHVIAAAGSDWSVECGTDTYLARKAFSCLAMPQVGDRVLLAVNPASSHFLLAILERDSEAISLEVPGDVTFSAPNGSINWVAEVNATVIAGEAVSMASKRLEFRSEVAHVGATLLRVIGRAAEVRLQESSLVSSSIDTVATQVTQKAKRVLRFVEQLDQVRTRIMDYRAEDLARVHSGNMIMTAEELVKLDGEQIHVG